MRSDARRLHSASPVGGLSRCTAAGNGRVYCCRGLGMHFARLQWHPAMSTCSRALRRCRERRPFTGEPCLCTFKCTAFGAFAEASREGRGSAQHQSNGTALGGGRPGAGEGGHCRVPFSEVHRPFAYDAPLDTATVDGKTTTDTLVRDPARYTVAPPLRSSTPKLCMRSQKHHRICGALRWRGWAAMMGTILQAPW